MILQTLFQQCNKEGVEFYNEFFVLDLIMVDGSCGGIVAYEMATGRSTRLPCEVGSLRDRRLRKDVQDHLERPHADRRRPGRRLPQGPPARGHGVLPVPSDGPLPAGDPAVGGGTRRGRRSCATPTASASWSATRRRSRTSLRATWCRARSSSRSKRAGDAGPDKDYILLDLTHVDPDVVENKLPDITEFARTYLDVDPLKEGVPITPTAHYAMGGIPTNVNAEVLAQHFRRQRFPGSTPPASAHASRFTGPTGSGRTRCSTSSSSGGEADSRWPSTRPRSRCSTSPMTSTYRPSSGSPR